MCTLGMKFIILILVWTSCSCVSIADAKLVIYNCDETNCQPKLHIDTPRPSSTPESSSTAPPINREDSSPPTEYDVVSPALDLNTWSDGIQDNDDSLCKMDEETGFYYSTKRRYDEEEQEIQTSTFEFLYEIVTDQHTKVSTIKNYIVPLIESTTSQIILSSIFDECNANMNNNGNELAYTRTDTTTGSGDNSRRSLFLRHRNTRERSTSTRRQQEQRRRRLPIVGMSMFPVDEIRHQVECEGKRSLGEQCFVIESFTTLQFASKIDNSLKDEIKSIEESLRLMIDSGELHNLHDDLVRVNYRQDKELDSATVHELQENIELQEEKGKLDKPEQYGEIDNSEDDSSFPYYAIGLVVFAFALLFIFLVDLNGGVCWSSSHKLRQTKSLTFDTHGEMFQNEIDSGGDEYEYDLVSKYPILNHHYDCPNIQGCMKVKTLEESLQRCCNNVHDADQYSNISESFHSAAGSLGESSSTSYQTATESIIKAVWFNQVHAREYKQTWTDNPSTSCGLPIGLSWSYIELETVDLNRYEACYKSGIQGSGIQELKLSPQVRQEIIMKSCRLSKVEILQLTNQYRKERYQNLASSGFTRSLTIARKRRLRRSQQKKQQEHPFQTVRDTEPLSQQEQMFWFDAMSFSDDQEHEDENNRSLSVSSSFSLSSLKSNL